MHFQTSLLGINHNYNKTDINALIIDIFSSMQLLATTKPLHFFFPGEFETARVLSILHLLA